jgi:hypothetical protein
MELPVLHKHGWSISALGREFELNWRTVKREVESQVPAITRNAPRVEQRQLFNPSTGNASARRGARMVGLRLLLGLFSDPG